MKDEFWHGVFDGFWVGFLFAVLTFVIAINI